MGGMMKQPDQLIHDELYKISEQLGYDTYTFLPEDGTAYPFVVMGETQVLPQATKSRLVGRLSASVHIWARVDDRRAMSDMVGRLMSAYFAINKIEDMTFSVEVNQSSYDTNRDNSTDEVLYHSIIYLYYKFF